MRFPDILKTKFDIDAPLKRIFYFRPKTHHLVIFGVHFFGLFLLSNLPVSENTGFAEMAGFIWFIEFILLVPFVIIFSLIIKKLRGGTENLGLVIGLYTSVLITLLNTMLFIIAFYFY